MREPWLVYVLVFAAVFFAVQFAYGYYTRILRTRRHVNRRLALLDVHLSPMEALELLKRERGLADTYLVRRVPYLSRLLLQSGLRLRGLSLSAAIFAIFIAWLVVWSFVFDAALLTLAISLAATIAMSLGALRIMQARRIGRFAEQLPDVIDIIVRSLKAGHPLLVSFSLVAREMPDPAGTEFGVTCDEITYGRDLATALHGLCQRVGYLDLVFLATAITVQNQTGGNLSEILQRLSQMLRARFKMRRKVKALSAEGRFSAVALSFMPLVVFMALNLLSPRFYGDVWGNPVLHLSFSLCVVMTLIGNAIMYKMVHFKF
ncbi:type II secretion system F family protein [Chelatococcus sp. SYSU_G07232]|uniref:Type II secretion system F family protein n=1 Tax=Chelatococcus albus TaxID=3047466 RepID=A0ABT7AIK4_9HYPH|nr:type II secretion system F family protein [Chelatococcus sp. SYSU_G07232]MDJ1159211.1 type II secretion system F family protein [Chelatococcus sp. SYSU_G07232]